MPTAEYTRATSLRLEAVLVSAKKAAYHCNIALGRKGPAFSVLISEVNGNNFKGYNLEEVKPSPALT